jgi:hypothetical protein
MWPAKAAKSIAAIGIQIMMRRNAPSPCLCFVLTNQNKPARRITGVSTRHAAEQHLSAKKVGIHARGIVRNHFSFM